MVFIFVDFQITPLSDDESKGSSSSKPTLFLAAFQELREPFHLFESGGFGEGVLESLLIVRGHGECVLQLQLMVSPI